MEVVNGLNGMEGLGDQPLTVRIANPRNEKDAQRMAEVAQMAGRDPSALLGSMPAPPPSAAIPGMDTNVDDLLNAAFAGVTGTKQIDPATFSVQGYGAGAVAEAGAAASVNQEDVEAALAAAFGGSGGSVEVKSRILVLHNMVTEDDLKDDTEYDELKEDIQGECATMGQLNSLEIPRKGKGKGKVYLEYSTVAEAIGAAGQLDGREFGDAVVKVEFMDERKYLDREY